MWTPPASRLGTARGSVARACGEKILFILQTGNKIFFHTSLTLFIHVPGAPAFSRHLQWIGILCGPLWPSVAFCTLLRGKLVPFNACAQRHRSRGNIPPRPACKTRVVLLPPLVTQRQRPPSPHRSHTGPTQAPHRPTQCLTGSHRPTQDHSGPPRSGTWAQCRARCRASLMSGRVRSRRSARSWTRRLSDCPC